MHPTDLYASIMSRKIVFATEIICYFNNFETRKTLELHYKSIVYIYTCMYLYVNDFPF